MGWIIPALLVLGAARPNIVVVLTDDQGYGDIGAHGNPVLKTPHLDRLRAEARRFTDFHVSPTCSPTRSALLTGRHEFKNGVTHTIFERERLAPGAITLAEVLKGAGYRTGVFGKWHLGDEDAYLPNRRGFDEVFIHGAGGIGQSYAGSCGDAPGNRYFNPAIWHNDKFEKTTGYCADVFFDRAMGWMDNGGAAPFFCWIATNTPHAPLDARPEDEARYAGKVPPDVAKFFGMVANVDDNIGRLLDRIKSSGREKNTLVLFMNDNGGTVGCKVFNAGMRGQKVTPFLGGTRASSFWRWPGTLEPGDIGALAAHVDVFPTLAEIAGVNLSAKVAAQVEGRSLMPLLRDPGAPWPDRHLFTHVGRWPNGKQAEHKYAACSVRNTRWHLVNPDPRGKKNWLLFDVKADPGEKTDLAGRHPEQVAAMEKQFEGWWESVQPMLVNEGAKGPAINPFKERYWKQFPGEKPAGR